MQNYIDNLQCFCINLPSRTDRWSQFTNSVAPIFPKMTKVDAINGKEITQDDIQKIVTPRTLFNIGKTRKDHNNIYTYGAIGCYLSHVTIWQKMVDTDISECLIFEDDSIVNSAYFNSPEQIMSHVYDIRNESYTVAKNNNKNLIGVFYSHNATSNKKQISNNIVQLGSFYLMNAYLLTNYGAKILLKNAFPLELQVDSYISLVNLMQKDGVIYGPIKQPFIQNGGVTDIQTLCIFCNDMFCDMLSIQNNNYLLLIMLLLIILLFLLFVFVMYS